MRNKSLVIISAVSLLVLMGCKKYEEGPWFSMRFKETRVEGTWLFEKFTVDGEDILGQGLVTDSLSYVYFSKGGEYEVVNLVDGAYGAESGVWHMGKGWKGKKYLEVDKNDRVVNYWVIKMKNNSLKYYFDDEGPDGKEHRYEIFLCPKIL